MLLEHITSLPVALLGLWRSLAWRRASLLTGDVADALVIAGVVGLNATIGYVTESQSAQTIHALKHLVPSAALTRREAQPLVVRAEEVAPGDVLILRPGTYVTADARRLEAQRLSVDKSALPGRKSPDVPVTLAAPLADRSTMVYVGTLIIGGQGLAVVVVTGQYRASNIVSVSRIAFTA